MKVRIVHTANLEQAKQIRQLVSDVKNMTVEQMTSRSRVKQVSYVRSLAAYFMLSHSGLQWDLIAELLNFSTPRNALHHCYHKIKRLAAEDEIVRQDVISISEAINKRA